VPAAAVLVNRQQRHATANQRLLVLVLPVTLAEPAATFKPVDEVRPPLLRINSYRIVICIVVTTHL